MLRAEDACSAQVAGSTWWSPESVQLFKAQEKRSVRSGIFIVDGTIHKCTRNVRTLSWMLVPRSKVHKVLKVRPRHIPGYRSSTSLVTK